MLTPLTANASINSLSTTRVVLVAVGFIIDYKKNGKTFYRKKCEQCLKNGIGHGIPLWEQAGYEKTPLCEKCGFKSKHLEQFNVYHIDGSLRNTSYRNLKTICANCQRVLQKEGVKWKQGDLLPDF